MDKNGPWGLFTTRRSEPDGVYSVIAISDKDEDFLPVSAGEHYLDVADFDQNGLWYTVSVETEWNAYLSTRQGWEMNFEAFRRLVPTAREPGENAYLAITYCPEATEIGAPLRRIRSWHVQKDRVFPVPHDLFERKSYADVLEPAWPVGELEDKSVLVLGCGSIGGAIANAVASYGVRKLTLVDPDRLLSHNVPRHIVGDFSVGRLKVDVLAEELVRRHPDLDVTTKPIDVIDDADQLWELLEECHIAICSVDGVSARRVVNHLARRAKTNLVLACVLADGRFGEVLRLRPLPDKGCLDCWRESLAATGAMDLEPTLDRGYGEGTRHNPMTAVTGDLHLTGQFAAKVAVAELRATSGDASQLLPGDAAYLGLRPEPGWAKPFDLKRVGEIRWDKIGPPKADCPTCGEP